MVKLQKSDDLLLNLVLFEACRTKGIALLRVAKVEAAKQLVIHIRCVKIRALILTAYCVLWLLCIALCSVGILYTFAYSIFKAALQKRGSMEPMEPPLYPPLHLVRQLVYLYVPLVI